MAPDVPDLPSDTDAEAAEELIEQHETKEDEVLEREGFEQELMQEDESEVGEEVEGVQERSKGEKGE